MRKRGLYCCIGYSQSAGEKKGKRRNNLTTVLAIKQGHPTTISLESPG